MVVVEDLSFGYRRHEPILTDLTHTFPAGATTAVTGPSGRGKSTLLYVIGLLLTPWSGRVHVGEVEDASRLDDFERSRLRADRVGFVFQDAVLDPSRTVLDNVIEGALYTGTKRYQAMREGRRLLERFGVELRDTHRPGEVSGGQAQRVALCRALIANPTVILADEPTGNLDADSADVVMAALESAAHDQDATVIIASHDPRVVKTCDQILQL